MKRVIGLLGYRVTWVIELSPATQATQVTQLTQATRMIVNALTIDVEDYFQVHAFSDIIRYEDWGNYESRVEGNTRRILDLLADPPSKSFRTHTLTLQLSNLEPEL